jgi:hypothetical protein
MEVHQSTAGAAEKNVVKSEQMVDGQVEGGGFTPRYSVKSAAAFLRPLHSAIMSTLPLNYFRQTEAVLTHSLSAAVQWVAEALPE